MRVLFITNSSTERCGVRVYGELWMQALHRAGVEILEWDGTYSAIQARGGIYLPPAAVGCDLVHLNWDPQAINHYLPEHFAGQPPLSLFLHDVPPNSTCPVLPAAKLVMAMEAAEGIAGLELVDHAVPPFTPRLRNAGRLHYRPVVGACGIRADPGIGEVEELCRRKGWTFNGPSSTWLSTEEEIARLAESDVNVCWYHATGRGKSMGAMFCVAAGKPLVLSRSTMFSVLEPYGMEDGIFRGEVEEPESLDLAVEVALGMRTTPVLPSAELAWGKCAERIKGLWEAARGRGGRA